jgi:ribosomal protein S27E
MRLECPDCHNQTFNIHVPPPHTQKPEQLLYVLCAKCGKLWLIKPLKLNEGFISHAELKPMVTSL